MQIIKAEVTPVELKLHHSIRLAGSLLITSVTAVFLRLETRDGKNAWGCTVAHPNLTGEKPDDLIRICQAGADKALDLHPTNLEYTLSELIPVVEESPAALCVFDLAFHDLLGLAAGMPLYRLLGGYRDRIQTSITIPLSTLQESVELACKYARSGFRMLKIKGGLNPSEDVELVRAIRRSLPHHVLRLDADGGYSVEQALDVTRALKDELEMLEQPTPAGDLNGLRQVMINSPIPILADQSVSSPSSALKLVAPRSVSGLSVKMVTCEGLRCARQVDAIAHAAQVSTMVSCLVEPALLIAAGLSFALSSPNVRYGDLDGHLDLVGDPTVTSFRLEEGWLVASDVPGLGCTVQLD
jgi:L-alanine-DL-glutamate epimerase-like enolase superfamily enzyme